LLLHWSPSQLSQRQPTALSCKIEHGGRDSKRSQRLPSGFFRFIPSTIHRLEKLAESRCAPKHQEKPNMAVGAKIAKTADRKKVMDTTKSTDCPKCGKPTRIVKRVKDRERGVPGGVYISCSACEFFEKL
jgi:DNA-directed RNA polymerase subunit M/transcription elongation factor TFIIS